MLDDLEEVFCCEEATIEQASQFSQSVPEPHQWQAFLNYLSLEGFRDWLNSREPGWEIDERNSPWRELDYLQWPIVPNLLIGQMKVCLLVTEMLPDDDLIDDTDSIVEIPQEFLQRPDLANHLYVVVSVLEEEEITIVQGYLRYDQIQTILQQPTPTEITPGTIGISFSQLDPDLNHLLLYLRLPEFAGIDLPPIPDSRTSIEDVFALIDLPALLKEELGTSTNFNIPRKRKNQLSRTLANDRVKDTAYHWCQRQGLTDYYYSQLNNALEIDNHKIQIHLFFSLIPATHEAVSRHTQKAYALLLVITSKAKSFLPRQIKVELIRHQDESLNLKEIPYDSRKSPGLFLVEETIFEQEIISAIIKIGELSKTIQLVW